MGLTTIVCSQVFQRNWTRFLLTANLVYPSPLSLSLSSVSLSLLCLDEIRDAFVQFGGLSVDWPHKAQSKAYFPPKGMKIANLHVYTVALIFSAS